MSFEEEAQLLDSQIQPALEGRVLVAKQLREVVERKVGHRVSDAYLFDLLHRHGWSKKAPRPEHPQAGEVTEKREAFKKKASALFPKGARPLKVFFEDEARFGRINKVSRCWVPQGRRARVRRQVVRWGTPMPSAPFVP